MFYTALKMSGEAAAIELADRPEFEINDGLVLVIGDLAMPEAAKLEYASIANGTNQLVIDRYAYGFNTYQVPID